VNSARQKFSIVSLGCARNLVDSEVMAGLLRQSNYDVVEEPAGADIVLVNTCGFIDAAKAESIDTILEIGRLKEEGKIKKLVVAGCLSQRYSEELARDLPEVDFFIGTGEVPRIAEILAQHEVDRARRQFVGLPAYLYDHVTPRLRGAPSYSTFLKVSEGCDHKCAFCIIPQLRGPHRSRSIDSVVKEAELLVREGVREINLIAQDLTAYGRDRKDGTTLYGLLRALDRVQNIGWIRLLYAYPNYLDDSLLKLIRDSDRICSYLDIPFQHVNRAILQRMRRGKAGSAVRETIEKLRAAIPGLTLRTSLIVGFPGETDADFLELMNFVEETRFERLGVFKYSDEEGTAAARLENKVPAQEIERRWQEIMDLQAEISKTNNETLIATTQSVMMCGVDFETKRVHGRTQGHAPEVDGVVYLSNAEADGMTAPPPGTLTDVRITQALEYDLIGEIIHV
jgi:ribosomal protein S12 methylthiotransferase